MQPDILPPTRTSRAALPQTSRCIPLLQAGLTQPMASEEAANPGAHPTTPAAPKKSRKKGKEKPEAGADAQDGGNEVVELEARIKGLTRVGHRALVLGDGQEAVGCFRKAFVLSRGTVSPQLRSACAFNLGAAYVESGKPKKGLAFLLQSQSSLGGNGEPSRDLYFSIEAAREGLQDFPKALEHFGIAADSDRAAQAGSRAGTRVRMGCCYLGMREPARAARCFLDAARCFAAAASPEAAAVALSRASGSMLQSRGFGVAEIAAVLAQCHSLCSSIRDAALRGNATLHPSLPVPGPAPTPGLSSVLRRETLQRHRAQLFPAPHLHPGC